MSSRVGVIGTGTMGGPVVAALAAAGRHVLAFDAQPESLARAVDGVDGAQSATSLAQVVAECDVVVLSLPTPAVVDGVVAEISELAAGPVTVLDTSTVGPDTSRSSALRLAEVGGQYADTPVLGRPAAVGSWTIPVGGDQGLVDLAAEVLAPVAKRVVGVGQVGAAATLKVLNNLMLGVINAATAEVLVLAERAGLDPAVFVDTVVDSGAASVSGLFRDVAPRAVRGDFTATFSVALMHKDNALGLALADEVGLDLPVIAAAQATNERGLADGYGAEDSIAVVKSVGR